MPVQDKFRVGLPEVPSNSIIGVGNESVQSTPPYALTGQEVAGILNANSILTITANTTFDANTHNFQMLRVTAAANVTITLPRDAANGAIFNVLQANTGQVVFANAAGSTLRNNSGYTKTANTWSLAMAFVDYNPDANTANWVISGDLA